MDARRIGRRGALQAALGLFAAAVGASAAAQPAYPARPIRIVLGSGPGGLADVTTRLVGEILARRLGQAVVVENKPGAGGITATQSVATAAPDGHTLMVMVTGNTIAKSLIKSLPYDLEKDFVPITSIAFFDVLLLVKGDAPLKDLDDLRALAASRTGGLNIGSTSTGSVQNLTSHLFTSMAGLKASVVPYKTSGEVQVALMRGDVDIGFDAYTSLKGAIDGRQLRALASSAAQRSPVLPAVPTLRELGLRDFEVGGWNSLYAPAGTPAAVVALLNRHVNEIVATPEVQRRFVELGAEPRTGTPEAMDRLMKSDLRRWAEVARRAGIRPE